MASEAEMLALTESQVQPGDFAVVPTVCGLILNALPPSDVDNWVEFTTAGTIRASTARPAR